MISQQNHLFWAAVKFLSPTVVVFNMWKEEIRWGIWDQWIHNSKVELTWVTRSVYLSHGSINIPGPSNMHIHVPSIQDIRLFLSPTASIFPLTSCRHNWLVFAVGTDESGPGLGPGGEREEMSGRAAFQYRSGHPPSQSILNYLPRLNGLPIITQGTYRFTIFHSNRGTLLCQLIWQWKGTRGTLPGH